MTPWLTVWCQGGPADDYRYQTLVEPPDEILIFADPFRPDEWMRVVGPWDGAIPYRRMPEWEQFDHERIYFVRLEESTDA